MDGKTYDSDTAGELVSDVAVTPEYFDTLGVPVLEGRGFTAPIGRAHRWSRLSTKQWRAGSGLTPVQWAGPSRWPSARGNIKSLAWSETTKSQRRRTADTISALRRGAAAATYNTILARTRGDAAALLAAMRRELLAMEPGLVFIRHETMEASMATSLLPNG